MLIEAKRQKCILFACLFMSGCVSAQSPESSSSVKAYENEIREYSQCNLSKSFEFSKLQGDVHTLAIAAEGACDRSKRKLANAIALHDGYGAANHLIGILERNAIRTNAGEIANFRARRVSN